MMKKQFNLIEITPSLDSLPSAKVRTKDKYGVHSWTNFYASFSENFATDAMSALGITESHVVLDPFVGAGTTLIAAKKNGIRGIGFDIDPFACILTRSKLSTTFDLKKVEDLLKPTRSKRISPTFSEDAKKLFDKDCLVYATSVFERITRNIKGRANVLDVILRGDSEFDSEAIALASICVGASESARVKQGSNPTWYRLAELGERESFKRLLQATNDTKDKMVGDLNEIKYTNKRSEVYILDSRSNNLPSEVAKADFIITSPPYLTRIDYAMKHRPYLAIMSGLYQFDFEELRRKMIGTPKILDKEGVDEKWGKTCLNVLEKIKCHSSYASEGYYVWTYIQYFKALFKTFSNFKNMLRNNGEGLIVLQDSFYKDIHIPLSNIAVEMLLELDFDAEVVQKDIVKNNMKQLNPAHQVKKISQKASEDVIYFKVRF